ncbi:MAG: hypothetical protein AB7L90_21165 [Hyphomicrobiaceae bacterium]
MITAALAGLGLGGRAVSLLTSPVTWAVVGWITYSALLIDWAGDRREARVRSEYAEALKVKNAELAVLDADGRARRTAAEADRRLAAEAALSPPVTPAAGCALPADIIAKLNRIR